MISLLNAAWASDEDGWPVLVEDYTPRHADTYPIEGGPMEDVALYREGAHQATQGHVPCERGRCDAAAGYVVVLDNLMGVVSLLCDDHARGYADTGAEVRAL